MNTNPLPMKKYRVFSRDESGKTYTEGEFQNVEDAEECAMMTASNYGKIETQDHEKGNRIIEIGYYPIWDLK